MEKIYRVQHKKDGRGPYRPGFTFQWLDTNRDDYERPPHFMEFGHDFLDRIPFRFSAGSGFRDLEQLKKWFSNSELNKLKDFGFKVVKLKVNRIIEESDKQLFFVSSRHMIDCIAETIKIERGYDIE